MIDYPRFHQDRRNLAIHIVAVPVFVAGTLGAIASLGTSEWLAAGVLATLPPLSLALQGIGHRQEPNPPLPFHALVDFVARVFAEQFYRFPAFVLTGGWARAWRESHRLS